MQFILSRFRRARSQPRVFILPNRYGYGFALLLVVMLLGAINYNNSLAHLLVFLLAAMGHVAMHHCYRNISRLSCKPGKASNSFAGSHIQLPISVSNSSAQAICQIAIASMDNEKFRSWLPFRHFTRYRLRQQLTRLEPQQTQTLSLPIPAKQRGWQKIGRLRVSSVYPLGLFNCWFFLEIDDEVLIYPKPFGNKPMPNTGEGDEGKAMTQMAGNDDFAGFRRFRPGENHHQIAWKALARDDILRTKQYTMPSAYHRQFRWQDVADIVGTENKLSQLCQWICTAHQQGSRFSLQLPGLSIAAGNDSAHFHRCLRALAVYEG
ncbi:DUF58 domain-containing protein [Methylophaga lonarensis]|uniref:DUF58 domain-containing protein n=1 Tax=Methylophaga lonarensis TaxID=999151 RepID=UPI003D2AE1BC